MKLVLMIIVTLYKYTKHIVFFAALFYVVFRFYNFDIGKIHDNEFLFQFIGILLGFAITIFQFIISMVEKIKENHSARVHGNVSKVEALQKRVDLLYKELRENITFIFASLIIISILFVPMPVLDNFTKPLHAAIFFLNIYAIYDLVAVSFKVSNTTALQKDLY